jgi:hypothetical protein
VLRRCIIPHCATPAVAGPIYASTGKSASQQNTDTPVLIVSPRQRTSKRAVILQRLGFQLLILNYQLQFSSLARAVVAARPAFPFAFAHDPDAAVVNEQV